MPAALRWRPSDPGRFALRTAIRTGIVMPATLALGMWLGNEQTGLFASFGAFALLVFVDFGGPRQVRLLAYGAFAVVSSALLALGTLCSDDPVLGSVTMLVVGFAILFSGVLNGYFAAASQAALLAYVLPTMVPGDAGDIGARLAGWWLAVALSVPAVMLLFPARPRDRLRAAVAAACRALAAQVRAPEGDGRAAVVAAVDELHARFAATPYRPTGPTGATGALAAMIDELDWLKGLTLRAPDGAGAPAATPAERALQELSADTLVASAALVEGRATDPPDRDALDRARERVYAELVARLDDPAVRDDDARLTAAVVGAWEVRVISFVARDVADRALLAGGAATGDGFVRRQGVALAASGRLAAAHAGTGSVWFRNSLRGAVGLAIAVLIAAELSVQHAFWVVLGALAVLRSSALNTGASVVQALLGTLIGIVVGGLIIVALGGNEAGLWIALPFTAMLAAYGPRAVSFAAGQAGFTVLVVILFNLIAPGGWQVGLIRLEDVAIGFAVSLAVGVLFWPRGASAVLRRSLDDALAAGARYAEAAFRRLATGAPAGPEASAAVAAGARLDVAFRQRLAERPGSDPPLPAHAQLISAATRLRATADAMEYLADRVGATSRPDAAAVLVSAARDLSGWFVALGAAVAERRPPPAVAPRSPELPPALLAAVREAHAAAPADRRFAGVAVVWAGLHVAQLEQLRLRCAEAATALADAGGSTQRRSARATSRE